MAARGSMRCQNRRSAYALGGLERAGCHLVATLGIPISLLTATALLNTLSSRNWCHKFAFDYCAPEVSVWGAIQTDVVQAHAATWRSLK
jgi:hypothetical protein